MAWIWEHFGKEKPHFHVARLRAGGENFEVLIKPEAAAAFRSGQGDISEVLEYDRVFADAKKGLEASEHVMKNVFKTVDRLEVARQIVLKGEVQSEKVHKKLRLFGR